MASNLYIIKVSPLLLSTIYNLSIYCAIRGMLLVAFNSYIIKTYHFYGLLFTIPLFIVLLEGCCYSANHVYCRRPGPVHMLN